jgi:hypothetical protein
VGTVFSRVFYTVSALLFGPLRGLYNSSILPYLGIGKCLFARFKMLPDTYVFGKGLLCEQYCCYGTIWALFPRVFPQVVAVL